jgi:hypothetical protein
MEIYLASFGDFGNSGLGEISVQLARQIPRDI